MLKIRVRYNMQTADYELFVFGKVDGKPYCAETVILKEKKEFTPNEPAMVIDDEGSDAVFQDLLDDLWSLGTRPSARADEYKAQLDSVNNHLNDMRALVFKDKRPDIKI